MLADAKKGFTQQIADLLLMDVSNYSRKVKGTVKVRSDEWEKLAKLLDVPVEDIYQSDESQYFICKDNAKGNYQGNNHIYAIPEHFIDMQRKYIEKLELEIEELKKRGLTYSLKIAKTGNF